MGDIQDIVDWMIDEGTSMTTTGNWHITYDEICNKFHVTNEWIKKNHETIRDEIDSRDEILSETWDDNDDAGRLSGFDMNFCLSFCNGWDGTDDWGCDFA